MDANPTTDEELSIEELRQLAETVADPYQRAAIEETILQRSNALVVEWIDFAYHYARAYRRYFNQSRWDDLGQNCLLGMTEASRKFDDARGKFSTIAAWYMRKQIQRMYLNEAKLVRHAKNHRPNRINKEMERMEYEGLEPSFDGACDRLEIPIKKRGALKDAWQLKGKEFETILSCNEPFEDTEQTINDVLIRERDRRYGEALARLPDIVKEVLLDHAAGVVQAETCERLGLSRPSVFRYRNLGIDWLRYYMGDQKKPDTPLIVKKELPGIGTVVPNQDEWSYGYAETT